VGFLFINLLFALNLKPCLPSKALEAKEETVVLPFVMATSGPGAIFNYAAIFSTKAFLKSIIQDSNI
jgi:hypothetical protein